MSKFDRKSWRYGITQLPRSEEEQRVIDAHTCKSCDLQLASSGGIVICLYGGDYTKCGHCKGYKGE